MAQNRYSKKNTRWLFAQIQYWFGFLVYLGKSGDIFAVAGESGEDAAWLNPNVTNKTILPFMILQLLAALARFAHSLYSLFSPYFLKNASDNSQDFTNAPASKSEKNAESTTGSLLSNGYDAASIIVIITVFFVCPQALLTAYLISYLKDFCVESYTLCENIYNYISASFEIRSLKKALEKISEKDKSYTYLRLREQLREKIALSEAKKAQAWENTKQSLVNIAIISFFVVLIVLSFSVIQALSVAAMALTLGFYVAFTLKMLYEAHQAYAKEVLLKNQENNTDDIEMTLLHTHTPDSPENNLTSHRDNQVNNSAVMRFLMTPVPTFSEIKQAFMTTYPKIINTVKNIFSLAFTGSVSVLSAVFEKIKNIFPDKSRKEISIEMDIFPEKKEGKSVISAITETEKPVVSNNASSVTKIFEKLSNAVFSDGPQEEETEMEDFSATYFGQHPHIMLNGNSNQKNTNASVKSHQESLSRPEDTLSRHWSIKYDPA